MAHDKRFKRFQEFTEDAPAMSAGAGGVAGIGQPPGSAFGEHPQQATALGGATTKTKKKNKRPEDVTEAKQVEMTFCLVGSGIDVHAPNCKDVAKGKRNRNIQNDWPEMLTPGNLKSLQKQAVDIMNDSYGWEADSGESPPWSVRSVRVLPCCVSLKEGFSDWVRGTQMSDRDVRAVVANAKAALEVYPDKLVPKLKRLLADVGQGQPNVPAVVRLRQFLRDNGMVYEWQQTADPVEGGADVTEERETFAGSPVYEVDTDKWMKSRFGKNRYHRYSRYVGEDEKGEEIRQQGRNSKDDIVLKDQATGAMVYFLRRQKQNG